MKIKSKILSLLVFIVMMFVSLQTCCFADASAINESTGQQTNTVVDTNIEKPYKNNELQHVFKKFLVSMGMVGVSCVVLYLLLRAFKHFKTPQNKDARESVDVSKNLTTPNTIEEATKLFIEKF